MAWTTWITYSGTTSSTTNVIWNNWSYSTNSNYTDTTTWSGWTSGTATTYTGSDVWSYWNPYTIKTTEVAPISEEERQRHEQERIRLEEVARQQREEEDRKRKIAEEKALQLLLENLTKNQAEIFKMTGAIPVESPSGRKYRINKGTSQNIEELDDKGQRKACLCFHPCEYGMPTHDVMLAQKMMLEVCEEEARKIANFS